APRCRPPTGPRLRRTSATVRPPARHRSRPPTHRSHSGPRPTRDPRGAPLGWHESAAPLDRSHRGKRPPATAAKTRPREGGAGASEICVPNDSCASRSGFEVRGAAQVVAEGQLVAVVLVAADAKTRHLVG